MRNGAYIHGFRAGKPPGASYSDENQEKRAMSIETMRRRQSDGVYLHQDFHGALSCGVAYLDEHYGADAVRAYLREFALAFYAPLRAALAARGLAALHEHFAGVYAREGGEVDFTVSADELTMRVAACPAVRHMRAHGYPVARLFHETSATVNAALCEGTAYAAELLDYEPETGRCVQRFFRRRT